MAELNTQQEDLVLDQQRDMVNEIDDGAMDSWIFDNFKDLKEEYIKESFNEKSDDFKEFCENRWNEANE